MNGVATSGKCLAQVPPRAMLHRHGSIVFDYSRFDFVKYLINERCVRSKPCVGIGIFGIEIGNCFGVISVAEPRPRILRGSCYSIMDKWNLGSNWGRELIERGSGHQCRVDQSGVGRDGLLQLAQWSCCFDDEANHWGREIAQRGFDLIDNFN